MAKKLQYFQERMPSGYEFTFDFQTQRLTYTCDNGHTREIGSSQGVNRFSQCKKKGIPFCPQCNVIPNIWLGKCQELGYTFISHDPKTRILTYTCPCGNQVSTSDSNLSRSKGGCKKCSQNKSKNTLENLREIFTQGGCVLLATEYLNNKVPLEYRCSCGNESLITLSDFNRNRRCGNCAQERTKETNITKYGVKNVGQVEEFKEKSRETCMKVYGVPHHMQNAEIFRNSKNDNNKSYVLPSGNIIHVSGDEDICLNILLGRITSSKYKGPYYNENQLTFPAPSIPYMDTEGKSRVYHTDIQTPDYVIEVKSIYYFNKEYQQNNSKFNEASKHYSFQVWIFTTDKQLQEIITYKGGIGYFLSGGDYKGGKIKYNTKENKIIEDTSHLEDMTIDVIPSIDFIIL